MDTDIAVTLTAQGVTVDAADVALLQAIDSEGSLNAAADALGRSYSRAHKRLQTVEAALGPLVERERGGTGGGGSALTAEARALLARFARVQAVLSGTAGAEEIVLRGTVTRSSGRLVSVESPAGALWAIAAGDGAAAIGDGDEVTVSLTADAVTLQDPDASPSADRTSARNRLRGTVAGVDREDGTATVAVDVGTDAPLTVLVTEESCDRLGLADGTPVVATFKATAARATPAAVE